MTRFSQGILNVSGNNDEQPRRKEDLRFKLCHSL